MPDDLVNTSEAARRLGIARTTLYQWLAQSTGGTFALRGRSVTIEFFQTGRRGQGRIQIAAQEIERLRQCMKVTPRRQQPPRVTAPPVFPGITAPLGRPKG